MNAQAIRERVKVLLEEISQIRRANDSYANKSSHVSWEMQAHTERRERLEEIKSELAALGGWALTG